MSTARHRRSATLDEVARAAGVSRATASRAINGGNNVSPRSRQAVAQAVQNLGFSPNRAAQSLAGKATHAVALVVPEPSAFALNDPFIGAIINGASMALADTDLQLVLLLSQADRPSAKTARFLNPRNIGGVIVASHHTGGVLEQILLDSGLPAVFVGRPTEMGGSLPYVDLDNYEAGRLATNHLIAGGHKRIATITGPADMAAVIDRQAGWLVALKEAGLAPGPVIHSRDFQSGAEEAMEQILAQDPNVDALFAQSDLLAVGAMRVLASSGRRVPTDVAVVGVDNFTTAISSTPQLTTVDNPAAQLAVLAAELLMRRMEDPAAEIGEPQVLAPRLAIRESA